MWPKYSATHPIGQRALLSLLPNLLVGKCPWTGAPLSGGVWPSGSSGCRSHLTYGHETWRVLPHFASRIPAPTASHAAKHLSKWKGFYPSTAFCFLTESLQRRGCRYISCSFKSYSENNWVFRKYFRVRWSHNLQRDTAGPRGKQARSNAFICNKLAQLGLCSQRAGEAGWLSSHNSTCVFLRLLKFPPTSYSTGENSSVLVRFSILFH